MTWAQYLSQGIANADDVNTILPGSKYGTFYGTVMNHLDEMRLQISQLPEEEKKSKQKLVAAADVLQAYFALTITDQYGDIPIPRRVKVVMRENWTLFMISRKPFYCN